MLPTIFLLNLSNTHYRQVLSKDTNFQTFPILLFWPKKGVNSTSFHLVHYSEFKSNMILSNNPWSGHHLVHLFTGPANMSRLSLSLPYKLKMSNSFLSQAYKGVTNWMTAFIDYTSNMHAEKNTLSISFPINIFYVKIWVMSFLNKLNFSMFW